MKAIHHHAPPRWSVAKARQHLSQVLRAAGTEPQVILNRNTEVAAVLDPTRFGLFLEWLEEHEGDSIAKDFEALRRICIEEGYAFEVPMRVDRPNTFARRQR